MSKLLSSTLKKLTLWLIIFNFSLLVSNVFMLTTQEKAFFYITFGILTITILIITIIITIIIINKHTEKFPTIISIVVILIFSYIIFVLIFLALTWLFAKIFSINFYIEFQIITFCICKNITLNK